jgi:hypothetical protein
MHTGLLLFPNLTLLDLIGPFEVPTRRRNGPFGIEIARSGSRRYPRANHTGHKLCRLSAAGRDLRPWRFRHCGADG